MVSGELRLATHVEAAWVATQNLLSNLWEHLEPLVKPLAAGNQPCWGSSQYDLAGAPRAASHRPWAWVVTEQVLLKSETELLNLSEPNLKGLLGELNELVCIKPGAHAECSMIKEACLLLPIFKLLPQPRCPPTLFTMILGGKRTNTCWVVALGSDVHISLFHTISNAVRQISRWAVHWPIYEGSESLYYLPKVTQLRSVRTGMKN